MAGETGRSGLDGLIGKAKELLTDERIEQIAEKVKERTPDNVDQYVDKAADKAKEHNDK